MMPASTLWGSDSDQQVTCIACGETLSREDKDFEYLCKPCHRECCHQNRDGLEETLVTAGAGQTDRKTFLKRYCELAADNTEPNSTKS